MSMHNDNSKTPPEPTSAGKLLDQTSDSQSVHNPGRRKITRLGVGAPIVLTLASRSVLAAQCLSNMLSGNLSDPNRGDNCILGLSPGGWGQPGGNCGSYTTTGAWTAIGFNYGTYNTSKSSCKPNDISCYSGGSKISAVPSVLIKERIQVNTLIRDVLLDNSNYTITRHLIAAYFNAKLREISGTSFMYMLTVQQVLDLASGKFKPPGGLSINNFLDTTWK